MFIHQKLQAYPFAGAEVAGIEWFLSYFNQSFGEGVIWGRDYHAIDTKGAMNELCGRGSFCKATARDYLFSYNIVVCS